MAGVVLLCVHNNVWQGWCPCGKGYCTLPAASSCVHIHHTSAARSIFPINYGNTYVSASISKLNWWPIAKLLNHGQISHNTALMIDFQAKPYSIRFGHMVYTNAEIRKKKKIQKSCLLLLFVDVALSSLLSTEGQGSNKPSTLPN